MSKKFQENHFLCAYGSECLSNYYENFIKEIIELKQKISKYPSDIYELGMDLKWWNIKNDNIKGFCCMDLTTICVEFYDIHKVTMNYFEGNQLNDSLAYAIQTASDEEFDPILNHIKNLFSNDVYEYIKSERDKVTSCEKQEKENIEKPHFTFQLDELPFTESDKHKLLDWIRNNNLSDASESDLKNFIEKYMIIVNLQLDQMYTPRLDGEYIDKDSSLSFKARKNNGEMNYE